MSTPKSIRQQFADTMLEVGGSDNDLVVIVGDISHGILKPFAAKNPDRYFNIGILEPTMISVAAGISKVGLIPVAHTIAPFIIERSFEQLKLDFCYHGLRGNIVTVGSAFDYSNLGCTHHCYGDFALLKTLPSSQIFFPGSALEFDLLFKQEYRSNHLNVFRISAFPHTLELDAKEIAPGKGIKIAEGSDVTLVAVGPQLRSALTAREILKGKNISAEVIYLSTVRPLDRELIRNSVQKTRRVVVVEEHLRSGGVGDDILREIYGIPDLRFSSASIPDQFVLEYGTYEDHCLRLGLTGAGVAAIAESLQNPS